MIRNEANLVEREICDTCDFVTACFDTLLQTNQRFLTVLLHAIGEAFCTEAIPLYPASALTLPWYLKAHSK